MEKEQIENVMEKYKKAWETQSLELIAECFSEQGEYQESPLSKPFVGHDQIKEFWKETVCNNQSHISFSIKNCWVSADNQTGFCEWECTLAENGVCERMVGIMILKMEGDKITHLNEYWNTQKIQK